MIVDDNPAILKSLRRILESKGYEVVQASDGQVALRHFAGRPTDLVISDIYMPSMDGIQFLMRVKETFPSVRIIAMSGGGHQPTTNVLAAARMLGAVSLLSKPFDAQEVLDAVEVALGQDAAG